jgi:hypothetical protein
MKKRALKTAILAMVAAAVVLAAAACANPVAAVLNASNWGLVGTWGNPAYTGIPSFTQCGFLYVKADGKFRLTSPDGSTYTTGTYVLGAVSLSGTTRTYQIQFTNDPPALGTTWVLAQVSNGTTYESVSSVLFTYPTSISTSDGTYGILTLR